MRVRASACECVLVRASAFWSLQVCTIECWSMRVDAGACERMLVRVSA